MPRNCFDGYLAPECANCEFWRDGSEDSIGCEYPGPIDNCKHFSKVYWEEWIAEHEEEK